MASLARKLFYPRQKASAYFLERPLRLSDRNEPETNESLLDGRAFRAVERVGRYCPLSSPKPWATRERVALYDMTSLKPEVTGPGALILGAETHHGQLDKPAGSNVLTLMLDGAARHPERRDRGTAPRGLVPARPQRPRAGHRDERHLPSDGSVSVTSRRGPVVSGWGPAARELRQRPPRTTSRMRLSVQRQAGLPARGACYSSLSWWRVGVGDLHLRGSGVEVDLLWGGRKAPR